MRNILSLSTLALVSTLLIYKGQVKAEGFYCNVPGSQCEGLNVNDCRSIYYNWEVTGACTVAYPDIADCAAATSCTY